MHEYDFLMLSLYHGLNVLLVFFSIVYYICGSEDEIFTRIFDNLRRSYDDFGGINWHSM